VVPASTSTPTAAAVDPLAANLAVVWPSRPALSTTPTTAQSLTALFEMEEKPAISSKTKHNKTETTYTNKNFNITSYGVSVLNPVVVTMYTFTTTQEFVQICLNLICPYCDKRPNCF
jgi:hypothetical protein